MHTRWPGIRLVLSGLDAPVVGRWNRLRLEQVVINLLTHAIKYGRGQPISLELRQDQEHIFERFERAVSEQHYSGFGLGLWSVREIVQRLGGCITVNSTPGVGSAFTVALPAAPRRGPLPCCTEGCASLLQSLFVLRGLILHPFPPPFP